MENDDFAQAVAHFEQVVVGALYGNTDALENEQNIDLITS